MPPLMFAVMVVFLLIGFPVAFSLAAIGLMFGAIGVWMGQFDVGFLHALPLRFHAIVTNDLLLSIPFFTMMGAVLERCRLAEDLLEGVGKLFGGMPGGVAFAVVLVGAVLGAITGTVAASVVAMGVISLPVMMRYGYNMRLATGVIAASGTITQLVPPSLVLIVLADQLGRSVGDMYLGAIGPSVLQIAVFLLFILAVAIFRPNHMPPLPAEVRSGPKWKLIRQVLLGMLPAAGLMFLVLGTILAGWATPTESGAMGAVGAMLLAALNRRLTLATLWSACQSTVSVTTMVIFILMGSTIFTLVFHGMDGGHWVEHLLTSLPGGQTGFLLFVAAFIFVLAFFLDFFEIAFILIPLLAPAAKALGIDMVWFGVLVCVVMQTSFMHPPFGVALYYIRGIAPPSVKSSDIYLGAIPWILLQLVVVVVVVLWPQSVTYWHVEDRKLDKDVIEQKLDSIAIPVYE
ncbi:MAG: TRAP transporter large permease subunit [Burkholderiaceae bacterium]|nr:TRAP transporter large permease subunit [Burkholderiaceae bacterium]